MERSLVERAQAGDRDAFEMLVRQKVDAVYRTAYAILGSEADAQDATQETFIAAWRSLPRLREPDKFPAWLAGSPRTPAACLCGIGVPCARSP